jgi:hypothetical protein
MHVTDQQAFHYGVHRSLKGQHENVRRVKSAWLKHRDRARGFALIGSMVSHQFSKDLKFNYSDSRFVEAFQHADQHYDSILAKVS